MKELLLRFTLCQHTRAPLFELGELHVTPAARPALKEAAVPVGELLARHQRGVGAKVDEVDYAGFTLPFDRDGLPQTDFALSSSSRKRFSMTTRSIKETTSKHRKILAGAKLVDEYVRHSLACNTVQAYRADLRHFREWGGRIPATPQTVARYVAEQAGKLKPATLRRHMAAIASAHTNLCKPSPTRSLLVQNTLRGIRRVHGTAQIQAKPISLGMLRQMARPRKDLEPLRDLRDRVLLVVGFAGGFRRSELAQLTPQHLAFVAQGVEVKLDRSKTDQHGKGRVVALPRGPRYMCPVGLLQAWLLALKASDPMGAAKPLFRRVHRHGQLGGGLGGAAVGGILRQRLGLCGLEHAGYSAHSLRAGLVTSAALARVPTWAIQRQTGHRSESTVHRYIRGLSAFEENAFRAIAKYCRG